MRAGERKEEGERGREDSKWGIHRVSHGNMRKFMTSVQQRRECTSVREVFGWKGSGRGRQIWVRTAVLLSGCAEPRVLVLSFAGFHFFATKYISSPWGCRSST